jgi:hypothetical protein
MSKEKTEVTKPERLDTATRSGLVRAFSDAYEGAGNNGTFVTQLCNSANALLKKRIVGDDDLEIIVSEVARKRGWKEASIRARKSEARAVLRVRETLPAAVASFRNRVKNCDWHQAMLLARFTAKFEGNVNRAVNEAVKVANSKGKGRKITTANQAKQRAAMLLKQILNLKFLSNKFRGALRDAAVIEHINLGAK